MRDRLLLAGLICCAPIAAVWLLYRRAQWDRRGFRGTYEQPIPPCPEPALDLEIEEYLWAEPGTLNPDTIH